MIPERETDDEEVGGSEDHHSTAQTEVRGGQHSKCCKSFQIVLRKD